jgi:hypothetical protein
MEEKMKSKINVKQEQRIGKFVRDFSIVVQDERSVNYNILRNMLRELLNSQSQSEEKSDDDNNWYCSKCGEPADKGEHICDEDYKKKVKDALEEWEDRIRDLILDISADRLVSSEKVVAIVQSLLDDREREVVYKFKDEAFKRMSTGGVTLNHGDILLQVIQDIADKLLNSKKK